MTQHTASSASSSATPPPTPAEQARVTLRSAGELVDALPYLLGFHPDESIVIMALHGEDMRFGGRLRFDLPTREDEWAAVARQLADYLVSASLRRVGKPQGALVFLCSEPGEGEKGHAVMERLRPLAQELRTACGALEVPVFEALCVSGGRWWSYVCPDTHVCSADGVPVDRSGTSVMAAAAAFAGIRVRGGLRQMAARYSAITGPAARDQEAALDRAAADLMGRLLAPGGAAEVRRKTAGLVAQAIERFRKSPPEQGPCTADGRTPRGTASTTTPADGADTVDTGLGGTADEQGQSADQGRRPEDTTSVSDPAGRNRGPDAVREAESDRHDDSLLTDEQAAHLIIGLQDKHARDEAAEWMEPADSIPALRLWRALARRCVGAFQDHAAPPLALAGWVAWSSGDEADARVALHRSLAAEPDYTFAQLLQEACNEGLDPEPLRSCLRAERQAREGGC